jgi:hypothetical protein
VDRRYLVVRKVFFPGDGMIILPLAHRESHGADDHSVFSAQVEVSKMRQMRFLQKFALLKIFYLPL